MVIANSGNLTASTIVRQSFANFYNLINARSNVTDPADSTGERKFVYQRMPDLKGRNFDGYPFIIVSRSRPNKSPGTADLTKSFMAFNFLVGVYVRDKGGTSNNESVGANTCDEITDSVRSTLDSVTNRKTLINYGMRNIEYDIDTDEDEDMEGQLVYISEFDVRFINNLTTTG